MLESEGIHMVTLYDLQEILNHKELWEDEQEHKYIIKRVEAAKNHSLPRSIIEEVFPFGHNNNRLNTLKTVMENEVLLKYLQDGNVITTRTAPDKIGIADVRANIRDLRDAGIGIKDKWVSDINRRGRKTRYKEYWLETEQP